MKLTAMQKNLIARYGQYFFNTGGNNVIELIEREDVSYDNNVVVFEMQGSCYSQVLLFERLLNAGEIWPLED